ncbi:MAG: AMP-binding protein [Kordiimonadaceae bacterium]|jgi:2-aminobenzoate-CoA ligase|nr:AMP-binding protein [Kordiimonadaceae bacterium]
MTTTAHIDTFAKDRLPTKETWPEFIFGDDVPEYPDVLNAAEVLLKNGFSDRPAIRMGEILWTYDDLDRKSNNVAEALTKLYGLIPGNRVLLRGNNTPMLAALWYGVLKAGGVVVTTMTMLRQKELNAIIGVSEPEIIIIENDLPIDLVKSTIGKADHVITFSDIKEKCEKLSGHFDAVQTASDDVALLAFTSGTTGLPKATVHFHRDILAMADSFAKYILKLTPNDVVCGSPPLAFTFGLGGLLVFPARAGASVVYFDGGGPEVLLNQIEHHKVTTLFTAPTAYKVLTGMTKTRDISSLKTCVSAGENLPLAVSDDFFHETGIRLIDGIGATEMIHVFISASGDDIKPGSTGKVVPGYLADIWDEDGNSLPDGEAGRLVVKGPTGCRYLNGDRQESYVENGWNVTGDIFKRDEEGYFWFVARGDDIIISAGYNIAAPEVEQAILTHKAVEECAVIGIPDDERGMIVKGFIVLRNDIKPSDHLTNDIQNYVKASVAPYKYPRAIEYIDALPKSATGKLLRKDLKN